MIELVCNKCGFSVRDDGTKLDLEKMTKEEKTIHRPGCGAFLKVEQKINMISASHIYHTIDQGHAMYYREDSSGLELLDMYEDYVLFVCRANDEYDEIEKMVKNGLDVIY